MIFIYIIAISLFVSAIVSIILGGANIGKNNMEIGKYLEESLKEVDK